MLSRVADSLFWMSRYIERAENNARIADVNLQLLLDLENTRDPDTQQQWNPIISSLEENELFTSLYQNPDGQAAVDFVCLQRKNPNSVYSCLAAARENGLTYGQLINGLKQAGVTLDRKSLSELAVSSPKAFASLAQQAKGARKAPAHA